MKNMKKILCMLLTLMLVMGIVAVATLTTTMAAPQTGWNVNSTVTLRSVGTQWDQLTIVWDHFRDTTSGASNGFNNQARRTNARGGPTAFSVWSVEEVRRGDGGDVSYHPVTVHANQNLATNAQRPVRVWSERTTSLERLQVRQPGESWHGELEISLTIIALCTTENTPADIQNAPNFDFNDELERIATLNDFNNADTDYIDNFMGSGLRLVRKSHSISENLLNVEGLTQAIADAQRILDRNDSFGFLDRYQEDFIEELTALVAEARVALESTDVVGIGDDIYRLTNELRGLVNQANSHRFFLHEVLDPIAPGVWGFIEFLEVAVNVAAPLVALIQGVFSLVTQWAQR